MAPSLNNILPAVENIARDAGAAIMKHYAGTQVHLKEDGSEVTDADHDAEKIILSALKNLTPLIPIVAEERVSAGDIPDVSGGTFWTVDPLDGTWEFINKTGAFVVALGLVVDGQPALGVLYHPAMDIMYSACGKGTATKVDAQGKRTSLPLKLSTNHNLRVVLNGRLTDMPQVERYLARYKAPLQLDTKSGIIRACQVAEGTADISIVCASLRDGRTACWDVVPGHAIVMSAGGRVEAFDGKPLKYNAADLQVPPHVVLSSGMKP